LRFVNLCEKSDLRDARIQEGLLLQREAMILAKQWSDKHKAKLVIALFPTKEMVYDDILRELEPSWRFHCDMNAQHVAINGLAKDLGIPIIDLLPAFREAANAGTQLYFSTDDHWNPTGNYLAFTVVRDALMARGRQIN
jgi:hypothetical protein